MLIVAIITITLALLFYSVGVWSEKLQGGLKRWHVIIFWIGLVFDTTGTTLMSRLTNDGFTFNFHGITGVTAILLMLIHEVWATVVILHNNSKQKQNFHRFSIVVWIIWLIPFVSGMLFGVSR
ncbi:HsmA family protein [Acetanaerobacterium elongatum]|uniref:TIGR03987 family protein n=1 Tax=Acetanaerobacterium elongatum TaxID=258515 RepID=A0A1G9ZDE8_9FIRM|nr:HsmA family protein [Acetanaerobacterium elongatum]SDN18483.1 TIGR03987 family protein [Acetanaerobacterium elongatum]